MINYTVAVASIQGLSSRGNVNVSTHKITKCDWPTATATAANWHVRVERARAVEVEDLSLQLAVSGRRPFFFFGNLALHLDMHDTLG